MVYKKYIKKGDKLYGPYYYHSRREGGKVVSEYHGSQKKFDYKKFIWVFAGIFLVIVLIYGFTSFEKGITGRAILNLDADYQEGEPLEGNLKLILREGELIPASSKIVFETSEQKYEYSLNEIISEELVEGDFYISGEDISGTGVGYGIEGISDTPSIVYFTLDIYSSSAEESGEFEEPVVEENVTEEEIPIEQEIPEEETGEEIPTEEITEEEPSITGALITGMVSLEITNEINGQVSAGNDFVLELSPGETAEIMPGSVETDFGKLSDDMVELNIEENKAVVTTSYSEIRYGFGEDYLGNEQKEILIDLSGFDLIFNKGELKISLVYNAEELISFSTSLESGEPVTAETPILVEEPEITETIEEETIEEEVILITESNITIEEVSVVLTDEEKAILFEKFGNASVEITEAKVKKDKIEIRYEFEDYWFEASYDASLSQEDLEAQREADKIKWLKDIVKSLTKEEAPSEEIEWLLG